MASTFVLALCCLNSSEVTGSSPYNNLKGVKFITLQTEVLWLHTALGNSSAHLPFGLSSNIFLLLRISVCLISLLHNWTEDDTLKRMLLRPHLMVEILKNVAVKLLGIVDGSLSGHSEVADYVLPEKSLRPTTAILTRAFVSIHLV
jgi:hypothetical protein